MSRIVLSKRQQALYDLWLKSPRIVIVSGRMPGKATLAKAMREILEKKFKHAPDPSPTGSD